VSMARAVRPLLGGWTIGTVFTPTGLRGRGYAGAAVHALSAALLRRGAGYIVLYTDLANPVSNHLYQRIGFQPGSDRLRLLWRTR
jgi:predicted GNAT family acetyltransferase